MIHRTILTVLTLASAVSPAAQPTAPALLERSKAFQQAWKAKDAAKVAAFYAEDAVLMPANSPTLVGRKAIEQSQREQFASPDGELEVTPHASEISADLGYIRGGSVLRGKSPKGEPFALKGKYLEVWKKVGGLWVIAVDTLNSDGPPPPPPVAPTPPVPPNPAPK